jgi:hypothetical protein
MKALRSLSPRAATLVDQQGFMLVNPSDGSVIGIRSLPPGQRLVYALQTNTQSGLTRRYVPALSPGETAVFAIDYSAVIPLGVGIAAAQLGIFDRASSGPATELTWGSVSWYDRTAYAEVTAANTADGIDFLTLWTVTDTDGNIWPRTALLLCALTS